MSRDPHDEAVTSVMDGSAWEVFCRQLLEAGRLVISAAPDDPFDRAEGLRYVSRVAAYGLTNFIERSDPATSVVTEGLPKIGGDNPDYLYASAPLSADFEYRLRGNAGDARYLGVGTYTGDVGTADGLKLSGYLNGSEIDMGADGSFEITVSLAEKPGNWLPMLEGTTQLMTRQTLLDRKSQRPAVFEIERTDGNGGVRPLAPERFAAQLERTGEYVSGAVAQFLEWTKSFAARPNSIDPLDPELAAGAQGDPFTHYFGGYYDIAPDEALVVELVPPKCDYWNLQLCNHWLESLDYGNHVVHVNDHTAVSEDGKTVRIVVAHRDPGVANWLDTAGHLRGCMVLRQVGTPDPHTPACRVVRYEDLST